MKNFKQRAVTGLTFAFVLAAAILYGPVSFLAAFLLISVLGILEFYKLLSSDQIQPQIITGLFVSQVIFTGFAFWFFTGINIMLPGLILPLLSLVFFVELYRKKTNPFQNIAVTLLGMIYFTLPLVLMLDIVFGFAPGDGIQYHGEIIMGCILILWASDTGAYMIGSTWGKHKLFPRISPNKSWEGFFGGLITAGLAAWLNSEVFEGLVLSEWIVVAVIIVVTGSLGDLVESMLKRSIHVKDSGVFFPGHGGILDRFDGLVLSMPFVYFYFLLIGKV